MDINSIMSSQLMQLQQTVQMSVLQNAMNMDTVAAVQIAGRYASNCCSSSL